MKLRPLLNKPHVPTREPALESFASLDRDHDFVLPVAGVEVSDSVVADVYR
jgi:hypothetical protein